MYQIGDEVIGCVKAIKSYGAFIQLPDDSFGLLHISEISHNYIKDIESFLEVSQNIKLKVIAFDQENRVILSKKILEKPKRKTKQVTKLVINEKISESAKGFSDLKRMLPYWIQHYEGE